MTCTQGNDLWIQRYIRNPLPLQLCFFKNGDWILISHQQDGCGLHASLLHANKSKVQSAKVNDVDDVEPISDSDVDNIVGVGYSSEIEVL